MTGHIEVFERRDGAEWIAYDTWVDVEARGDTRAAAVYNLGVKLIGEKSGRRPASEERVRDVLGDDSNGG